MAVSLVKYTVEEALAFHENNIAGNGKIEVMSKVPCRGAKDLTLAYTPGVAEACKAIDKTPELVHRYTSKDNLVAVVTDGTAVLGLGDIGPEAGMPVMEGKAVLFKMLAGVDAFPICLDTKDTEKIIDICKCLAPTFGGINLEDISAPRCFVILERLRRELDIPVFHDDQHGTATVVLAGMYNALKIVGKKMGDIKVAVYGAGASGIACADAVMEAGAPNVILVDSRGAIYKGRTENMNPQKERIALRSNPEGVKGSITEALKGADVFLGLSTGGKIAKDDVKGMAHDSIVFAMQNPVPEIFPEEASEAGATVVATGRSDYPNQINNVLGFPGIFRGALDVYASDVNEEMMVAAAKAIASRVSEKELKEDYIITTPVDPYVMPIEAAAVAQAAMDTGVAKIKADTKQIEEYTKRMIELNKKRFEYGETLVK